MLATGFLKELKEHQSQEQIKAALVVEKTGRGNHHKLC